MKILANENFPKVSIQWLRERHVDIISVGEHYSGSKDEEVMNLAIQENRTILTFDRDYGELIFKKGYKPLAGVVYFRWNSFTPEAPGQFIHELLTNADVQLTGNFSVIDENFIIRQRKI
ncbi:hypothetical protein BWI97_09890 [Siphonobacter sp. BAB-5405]|uniref:DUF5615 family PIN-like protein n=1 Tax=Siphonobacter sp. BAB-5405 TaxID=1864825 RepID=UPI000C80B27B|nr:DUF5615 family PIN-like protein [Siphonobacter sp. BAB-5405]PMD96982.1 hypothetical protein BWI97_09890 [Siphonobacter sp. BAB-5405]